MRVEIIKPIWGFKVGEKKNLTKEKAEFAIMRGNAVKEGEKAIEKAPKNKAIKKAPKNKQDFLGSQSFS